MGPLVPYILSNEFSIVLALLIGIAFGFILEQAGFSSTKKLVGLFYGYDFTVLRVFFTAGITAMIGVILLSNYGLLDIDVIFINPTYLQSAIVGGAIMGLGFIIGGFCPGTSICAVAIGKVDALAFVLGSLLGIFFFTEYYPAIKGLYLAGDMGSITFFEQLQVSRTLFAFMLTFIALSAFYLTWRIENKVNKQPNVLDPKVRRKYILSMLSPVVVLILITIIPDKDTIILNQISRDKEQRKCVFHEISADKLAYEITNNYYKVNIIDVRTPEEFKNFHLPLAINIPFSEIMDRKWESYFKQNLKSNVFYSNSDTLVRMACLKAKYIGKSQNLILTESADEFREMFFEPAPLPSDTTKDVLNLYNFRVQSARKMNDIVNSLQNINKPVKKEIRKVKGGCS